MSERMPVPCLLRSVGESVLEKTMGGEGVLSAVLRFSPGGRADLSCEEAEGIADSAYHEEAWPGSSVS